MNTQDFTVLSAVVIVVAVVIGAVALLSPRTTHTKTFLVHGPDDAVIELLLQNAPTETIVALIELAPEKHRGAFWNSHSTLGWAVRQNRTDVVQRLLELGADPDDNGVDSGGRVSMPPLMVAVNTDNEALTELLLRSGADCDLVVFGGMSIRDLGLISDNSRIRELLGGAEDGAGPIVRDESE